MGGQRVRARRVAAPDVGDACSEARKLVVGTIKDVSELLRNTPAVCRKCYMHPAVIEAFEADELAEAMPALRRHGLKADEAVLAIFLEKDAKRRAREAARKHRNGAAASDARLTGLLAKSSRKARVKKSQDSLGARRVSRRRAE